ncbi:MAG TPA: WecB/TagA/CpsF family glycosyltransferase [Candidatus Paceibacterota bacterium]|nr:WecB/TagA/CpsF family glycosyltransferase [Candidatus Paceibacterota bacterium]
MSNGVKIDLFGIKFDNLTMDEAIKQLEKSLPAGRQRFVVLPYSEFVVRAQKDEKFKNILNSADFCLCEGRGLYLSAKILGKKIKTNIYGVDLIYNIVKIFQFPKIFLFGATQDVIMKTTEKLGEKIVGFENGYQNYNQVIQKINSIQPNILLVGLGSPKQEEFIYENLDKMPSVKLAIGVGGAFDFISGKIKRAPKIVQKIGLEWLWRLILESRRISRIFIGVGGLIYLTFKNVLYLKK